MALIKNIETLRQYIQTNFTNTTSKLPDFTACENKFIVPLIGSAIYNAQQALADANNTTDPLLKLLRAAVAPLTYYDNLATIHLQIGDKGINTYVSENIKPLAKWEFLMLKDDLADRGCAALEVLLQYLFENKDTLEWEVPNDYKLLFLTGKEFAQYYPLWQPYRTFEFLRTICRTAEDEFLKPNIGEDFFEDLRDIDYSKDAAIAKKQKEAVKLLKKAAAFKTIKLATDLLPVKFNGSGFTVLLSGYGTTDGPNPGDTAAPESQIFALKQSCEQSAEAYMTKLMQYLQANASAELFTIFFESELYKSPTTEKPRSINEKSKNFYM